MTQILDADRTKVSCQIKQHKLVAILRLKQQNDVVPLIDCLVNAGINVLEITSNTPGFEQEIAKARAAHKNALIGAGTIINTTLAQQAIDAGAQFIVTPNTNRFGCRICPPARVTRINGRTNTYRCSKCN